MKRVLIIVFYWPPSGGSGVQRWLKFVKYLREFGWEPVVFTPLNPATGEQDPGLEQDVPAGIEVIRFPINDLNRFNKGGNSTTGSSSSLIGKIKMWVRNNLLIPDPRVLWLRPSVRYLKEYLKHHPVQAIVTSGPPQSMHLIGEQLHAHTGIPWLADFRDPWLQFLKFHGFSENSWAAKRQLALFEKVLRSAQSITVAHPAMAVEFKNWGAQNVVPITNGFDSGDFEPMHVPQDGAVRLLFSGILYDKLHSELFWETLAEHIYNNNITNKDLEIHFAGKVQSLTLYALEKYRLTSYCVMHGYLPHREAVRLLGTAHGLLLFLPSTDEFSYLIPGKLFEYMAAQRMIWCVASTNNDSSRLVRETQSGLVLDETATGFKEAVGEALNKLIQRVIPDSKGIQAYHRKALSSRLAEELNRISGDE